MAKYRLFLILFSIFYLSCSLAESWFSSSLAVLYTTERNFRGAETWPKSTAMAGPSFTFHDMITIAGPNIQYKMFPRKAPLQVKLGFKFIGDGDPRFSLSKHNEDYRNKRKDSYELYTIISKKIWRLTLGINYAKDIKASKGNFINFKIATPVIPFMKLHYSLSLGEKSTNQYAYGPEAVSGLGYQAVELSYIIPKTLLPWKGIIRNSIKKTWIIQHQNKNANYVQGNYTSNIYSFMLTWKFLE